MRRSTLGIPNSTHHTGATSRGQSSPTTPGVEEALEGQSSQSTDRATEAPQHAEQAQPDQAHATHASERRWLLWGTALQESRRVAIKRLWLGLGRSWRDGSVAKGMQGSDRGPELQHTCLAAPSLQNSSRGSHTLFWLLAATAAMCSNPPQRTCL